MRDATAKLDGQMARNARELLRDMGAGLDPSRVPTAEDFADVADRIKLPRPSAGPTMRDRVAAFDAQYDADRAAVAALTREQINGMAALNATFDRLIVALDANSATIARAWEIDDEADSWKDPDME